MTEEEERAYCEQAVQCFHGDMATLLMQKRAEAFEAGRKVSADEGSDFLSGHVVSLQAQLVASKQELRELRPTLSDRRDELTALKAKLARVECLPEKWKGRIVSASWAGAACELQAELRAALEDK